MVRRLPIYILADTSGSMEGDPIEAVKQGIRSLQTNLLGDPSAIETAWLSVISFDDVAVQKVPLTDICEFVPPDLDAGGVTSMASALRLLLECIDVEVSRSGGAVKGDWRPLVFLLTDGTPTDKKGEPSDDWREPAAELKRRELGNIIALACGEHASVETLKEIADTVLYMRDMSLDSFSRFFRWVSHTVSAASQRHGRETPRGEVVLPPPPDIVFVP